MTYSYYSTAELLLEFSEKTAASLHIKCFQRSTNETSSSRIAAVRLLIAGETNHAEQYTSFYACPSFANRESLVASGRIRMRRQIIGIVASMGLRFSGFNLPPCASAEP